MSDTLSLLCIHRDTRSDHLKDLQDMILMDQKSADCNNHDDDEGNDEGEEPVSLLGELSTTTV